MKLRAYEFDLSTPRDDFAIVEAGTELTVDFCDGEAWIKLDDKNMDPIPLHSIGSIHNASFSKLYLTNRAQSGKKLRFYVGYEVKLSRTYLTLQDIVKALKDEAELVEEFTTKDIIKQLVTHNIVTGDMIKYHTIMESNIADEQIVSRLLASECILAKHISAGAIASYHIMADAITSYHISANSIYSRHINVGEIKADHIATQSITVEKLESTLYGDLIQYITFLRAHQISSEAVSYTLTEGIFNDGVINGCYGLIYYGAFHIYSDTINRWDDENLTWDDPNLTWDTPAVTSGSWESDVFELDSVLTGILTVDLLTNYYDTLQVYAKFSEDGTNWSDWEELQVFFFSNRVLFTSIIKDFKYFKVKLTFSGHTDIYDIKIFAMASLLIADQLGGYFADDFVRNAGNAVSLQVGSEDSLPSPHTYGRLYVASDTKKILLDQGTEWVSVGGGLESTTNSDVTHYRTVLMPIDTRDVEFTYTDGKLTQIRELDGSNVIVTVEISYDENGRIQTVSQTAGGKTVTYTLTYSDGKLTGVSKQIS